MAVTVRDVAELAKVSPSVVSKVLHNRSGNVRVSEATAERVRKAAAEIGYQCNIWARNFRTQRSYMLGVLHGVDLDRAMLCGSSLWFASLMDGMIAGAFRNGYAVTLCPKLVHRHLDGIVDGRFDGYLWCSTSPSEEALRFSETCGVPIVLVHGFAEDFGNRHPAVVCDNRQGMRLGIEHLLGLGHRRIAFSSDELGLNREISVRWEFFQAEMSELGLPTTEKDLILIGNDFDGVHEYLAGARTHTAVICNNEVTASTWTDIASAKGIRVPQDLSVMGFDSTPFCEQTRPRITAISQPLAAMGERAVDLLVALIGEQPVAPSTTLFPCGLDIRESTSVIGDS